jgi:hypothetical protein
MQSRWFLEISWNLGNQLPHPEIYLQLEEESDILFKLSRNILKINSSSYQPGVAEVLKFGWVQYLSLLVVVWAFVWPVYYALITFQIIPNSFKCSLPGKSNAPWSKFPVD